MPVIQYIGDIELLRLHKTAFLSSRNILPQSVLDSPARVNEGPPKRKKEKKVGCDVTFSVLVYHICSCEKRNEYKPQKKRSLMKNRFFVALILGAFMMSAMAQQPKKEMPTAEERASKQTEMMKTKMGLTDDQAKKVADINLKFAKKMDEMKKMMEKAKSAKDADMQAVLTPEQYKQYIIHCFMMEQRMKQGMRQGMKPGMRGQMMHRGKDMKGEKMKRPERMRPDSARPGAAKAE